MTILESVRSLAFLFACASLAFAQLDSNSVTVTASRSVTLQPDQITLAIAVDAGFGASLSDILAPLQGIGVTAANLTGVRSIQTFAQLPPVNPLVLVQPAVEWTFTLGVPLSQLSNTLTTLAGLQKTIGQNNSGLTLSFQVQGTQVSSQLQQSQNCKLSDVLADARAQAQKLADAAGGVTLGPILAVSSGSVGTFSYAALFLYSQVSVPYAPPGCTLTVKFALIRFQ